MKFLFNLYLLSVNFFFHFIEDETAKEEGCSSNGRAVAEGFGRENKERIVSVYKYFDNLQTNPFQGQKGGKQYCF